MKVVQKQMCLYGRITLLSAWTFLEDCRRTICAALLRPHICGNYKFSFTLHPLHCDCCLHCDVEAQIIWKSLNKELLTLCCFYTVVSPLSSSWPCLCHLIYFSCNLPLILLTFSSQLLPPHPPILIPSHCFILSSCFASSVISSSFRHVSSSCISTLNPTALSYILLSQVAVSCVADIRGWVPGNESESDGAAEPTDGKGHRVVSQTMGQDVPASGREALRAGKRLLSCGWHTST